ncbi:MAG: ABC transporter ATP-binding protein [Saccharospirillum sp.]|nr:ABC transporter ATP-binding protein [Saccharospirillum sp.]
MSLALQIESLKFRWHPKAEPILSIDALELELGQSLFIQGASGSGKSTLLNLMAGVLTPQQGVINLLDQPVSKWRGKQRDQFRAHHIGYIFQQFNLLPYLTVMANVLLPCRLSAGRKKRALEAYGTLEASAHHWLGQLNIPQALWQRPVTELSVGQQQRVAAARALMGAPELIIADEPTSALDQDNVENFMSVLSQQCAAIGSSLIFVSHDRYLAKWFDQTLTLGKAREVAA